MSEKRERGGKKGRTRLGKGKQRENRGKREDRRTRHFEW